MEMKVFVCSAGVASVHIEASYSIHPSPFSKEFKQVCLFKN